MGGSHLYKLMAAVNATTNQISGFGTSFLVTSTSWTTPSPTVAKITAMIPISMGVRAGTTHSLPQQLSHERTPYERSIDSAWLTFWTVCSVNGSGVSEWARVKSLQRHRREEKPTSWRAFTWAELGSCTTFRRDTRARERQADFMAAQTVDIADDKSKDNGFAESVALARSRLRIDARKWLASKLAPKKYGEWRQTAKLLEGKPAQPKDRQGSHRAARWAQSESRGATGPCEI
jgi:hypothetical protein